MKRAFSLLLALGLLLCLCACDKVPSSGSNPDFSYTVGDQEMFSFEGVTVSVVPGKYNDNPEFRVKNTSDQDRLVVMDAVAYDDILLADYGFGIGVVYIVPAGADQKFSDCAKCNGTGINSFAVAPGSTVTDMSAVVGGNIFATVITQTEIKREYRFAVYSIDPDNPPENGKNFTPDEADLLFRSDLILLQSSDYDESKVSKQLPTKDPLLVFNNIKVWYNVVDYSFSGTGGTTVTMQSSASFLVDNPSDMDIRMEITITPEPNQPAKEEEKDDKVDKGDKGDKGDKEDDKGKGEDTPDPTSYFVFSEIPAGKASRNMNTSLNSKTPSWLRSGGLIMEIRIYNLSTGEVLVEDTVSVS